MNDAFDRFIAGVLLRLHTVLPAVHVRLDGQAREPSHVEVQLVGRTFAVDSVDHDVGTRGVGQRHAVGFEDAQFINDVLFTLDASLGADQAYYGRLVFDQGLARGADQITVADVRKIEVERTAALQQIVGIDRYFYREFIEVTIAAVRRRHERECSRHGVVVNAL